MSTSDDSHFIYFGSKCFSYFKVIKYLKNVPCYFSKCFLSKYVYCFTVPMQPHLRSDFSLLLKPMFSKCIISCSNKIILIKPSFQLHFVAQSADKNPTVRPSIGYISRQKVHGELHDA